MGDVKSYTRQHLEALPAYTPIEPFEVLSERLGRSAEAIIKLDANENPYGPSPRVRQALAELRFPHIYPDPESRQLREALAEFTGVPEEVLLAGAGADELIDLLLRLFLEPGESVLICPPTFGMYSFDTRLNAGTVIPVPRLADFSMDLSAIQRAVETYHPKLLFLAAPNNPDGSLPTQKELDALLDLPVILVLDEAYIEFSDDRLGKNTTRIGQVINRENLVVLRTFSKWAGLAGLRIGYGAFPGWMMPVLWKSKQPYNVNVAASAAAIASIQDQEYLTDVVARLREEHIRMEGSLSRFEWLHSYPSQSNFLLSHVSSIEASVLKSRLAADFGILVRYFNSPGLQDHIRISVGKPQDTDALIHALQEIV